MKLSYCMSVLSISFFQFPSSAEWTDAFPVILSLIIIEGLLSVDNALAIAAMASHLPEPQKRKALRWGIIGAYGFRGIAMAFAAQIAGNVWLKICGAAYLIYLMCAHFAASDDDSEGSGPAKANQRGFFATVVAIELMDLSLSVDNVVAAVAMSPKLWVICTGVFIAILALRFVAGACIKLIEIFPILEHSAFLLIGYVGLILVFELLGQTHGGFGIIPFDTAVSSLQKFSGIAFLLGVSLSYSRSPSFQRALKPAISTAQPLMRLITRCSDGLLLAAQFPIKTIARWFSGR
jgi:YkoY family integral membrane protein